MGTLLAAVIKRYGFVIGCDSVTHNTCEQEELELLCEQLAEQNATVSFLPLGYFRCGFLESMLGYLAHTVEVRSDDCCQRLPITDERKEDGRQSFKAEYRSQSSTTWNDRFACCPPG